MAYKSKHVLEYKSHDKDRMGRNHGANKKRKPFEVDKGRIIHSGAFRRLQGKTQVLGVGERDFYRTRLTHSLEVAQLGRGLCEEIQGLSGIDQDLVETICLAHDIGHSPFGHSGEDVLHEKLNKTLEKSKDAELLGGGFGANPQNLRIVSRLEAKYPGFGLDLTRACLDGLIKYTAPYSLEQHKDSCKFVYTSDAKLFAWVKKGVHDIHRKPIEGQVADWADQLAYSVNDIEDAVRAGIISFTEMESRAELIHAKAKKKFFEARSQVNDSSKELPEVLKVKNIKALARKLATDFALPSDLRLRKTNLKKWTSDTFKALNTGCRYELTHPEEPIARYKYDLVIPRDSEAHIHLLKAIASELIFSDPRVRTLEAKGKRVMQDLFDMFYADLELLPLDFQQMIESSEFGPRERVIADFIAGMTDRYAYSYYSRLTQPGSGSFYEFV